MPPKTSTHARSIASAVTLEWTRPLCLVCSRTGVVLLHAARGDRSTMSSGVRRRRSAYRVTEPGMGALRKRRCECGAIDCAAVIEMTLSEQDEVDHADDWWAVLPGHEPQGGRSWRIVQETDRFVVVEVEEAHS